MPHYNLEVRQPGRAPVSISFARVSVVEPRYTSSNRRSGPTETEKRAAARVRAAAAAAAEHMERERDRERETARRQAERAERARRDCQADLVKDVNKLLRQKGYVAFDSSAAAAEFGIVEQACAAIMGLGGAARQQGVKETAEAIMHSRLRRTVKDTVDFCVGRDDDDIQRRADSLRDSSCDLHLRSLSVGTEVWNLSWPDVKRQAHGLAFDLCNQGSLKHETVVWRMYRYLLGCVRYRTSNPPRPTLSEDEEFLIRSVWPEKEADFATVADLASRAGTFLLQRDEARKNARRARH